VVELHGCEPHGERRAEPRTNTMRTTKLGWILGLGTIVLGMLVARLLSEVERSGRGAAEATGPGPEAADGLSPLERAARSGVDEAHPVGVPSTEDPERVDALESSEVPDRSMRVFVADAFDGRPIAGARVTLHDRAVPVGHETDDDGLAVVPVLSMRIPARLRIEATGFCAWSQEGVPAPSVAVSLVRAATLYGRVLAADTGEPVGGAVVALLASTFQDGVSPVEGERT